MQNRIAMMVFLTALALTGFAPAARSAAAPEAPAEMIGPTPPRLAYLDGPVSYFRAGAEDWVEARVNTPLAPGDQLFAEPEGTFEIQIGPQAFLRGGAGAQVSLQRQEAGVLELRLTSGQAFIDLRELAPGDLVALETPQAALTLDRPGAWRLAVKDDRTIVIPRRGGPASATLADGDTLPVEAGEALTIEAGDPPRIASRPAPPPDPWDDWNTARTDDLLAAESRRYLSPGTYGAADLDRHGTWSRDAAYGPVWTPAGVPADWAPYSTGTWVRDPTYGWTWVDDAPWGWAPFHYGRWVYLSSRWCWAPGPRILRPVYAPALVAFFDAPGVSVSVSLGSPVVGWVALGWGEPLIPWWGRPGFIHRPWWGGWGGPRWVNGRPWHHRRSVQVHEIHIYHHSRTRHAVVAVPKGHFGRGPIDRRQVRRVETRQVHRLQPLHQGPAVTATRASLAPSDRRGRRPPEAVAQRPVVRAPRIQREERARTEAGPRREAIRATPAPEGRLERRTARRGPDPAAPAQRLNARPEKRLPQERRLEQTPLRPTAPAPPDGRVRRPPTRAERSAAVREQAAPAPASRPRAIAPARDSTPARAPREAARRPGRGPEDLRPLSGTPRPEPRRLERDTPTRLREAPAARPAPEARERRLRERAAPPSSRTREPARIVREQPTPRGSGPARVQRRDAGSPPAVARPERRPSDRQTPDLRQGSRPGPWENPQGARDRGGRHR